MTIRQLFTRFRAVAVRCAMALLLFAALASALLLLTPLADDVGKGWLERTLRDEGITLHFAEMRGTLATGVELTDLEVEKPGLWRVTAARARAKVSLLSLLLGRPSLSELLLEDGAAEIHFGGTASASSEGRLPAFGISQWQVRRLGVRFFNEDEAIPWVGSWSSLEGEGSFSMAGRSLRFSARSLDALSGDSRFPRLRGSGSLAWAKGSGLRVEFSAETDEAVIHHSGRIETEAGAPVWKGEWRCESLDLARLASVWPGAPERQVGGTLETELKGRELLWKGEADFGASGKGRGQGRLFFGADSTNITGTAAVEGFALGSPSLIPGVEFLALTGSGDLRWEVQARREGGATWSLAVEARSASVYNLPVEGGSATITSDGGELQIAFDAVSPLVAEAHGDFTVASGGGWSSHIQGGGVKLEPLLKALGTWRDPPEGFHVPTAPWDGLGLSLEKRDGQFSLAASGKNVSVSAARFDLGLLEGESAHWALDLDGMDARSVGFSREGRLSGKVAFTPSGPEGGLYEVTLRPSTLGGVQFLPSHLSVEARSRDLWYLAPTILSTSAGRFRLAGALDGSGTFSGTLHATLSDISPFAAWIGLGEVAGAGEADLALVGPVEHLRISGSASLRELRWGRWTAPQIQGRGMWEFPSGAMDWRATWDGLSISGEPLGAGQLAVVGPPGKMHLSLKSELGAGRSWTLQGEGTVNAEEVALVTRNSHFRLQQGEMSQRGEALLAMGPGGFLLENYNLEGALGRLSLGVRHQAKVDDGSRGHLRIESLPLEAFPVPPTAGAIGGTVSADLSWAGSVERPLLSGWARIEEGSYRFARSDLKWAPARLEVKAEGTRLVLTEGSLASPEGGKALATGWIALEGLMPGAFELRSVGKGMPFVIGKEVEAQSDFEVVLSGTLREPKISGRADILRGRLLLPDVARQAPIPSTVHFKNAPAGSPFAPVPEAEGPVVGRLRGEVTLHSGSGFWVSNRNLLGELTGSVVADFSEGGVLLKGGLQLRQGRYLFQGRTFEITTAKILFGGGGEEDLLLDVVANYTASDSTEVTARLFGRPERPTVQLSSRPPLDSSGILAVLLYDHRPEEMDAQEKTNWAAAAATLALQYQAGDLLESVTRHVGLDAITVVTGDTGRTAGIGLTKSIGDRVVLEYQQLFGAVPEERVNLRYRINRRLSFRGTNSSTEGSTADLLWEKRY